MPEASDTLGILYQTLLDAGCSEQMIEKCMDYARSNEWGKIIPCLADCKKSLLGQVRTNQKQIDLLDFLAYRIEKTQTGETK
ncbi:MAG: hypothetical protein GX851_00990 [Clostridiales bacterium]|nr:hypothetical protein [Clostridiales bacterium]